MRIAAIKSTPIRIPRIKNWVGSMVRVELSATMPRTAELLTMPARLLKVVL